MDIKEKVIGILDNIKNILEKSNKIIITILTLQIIFSLFFVVKIASTIFIDINFMMEILFVSVILFLLIPFFLVKFLARENIYKFRYFFNNIFFIIWLYNLDLYVLNQCTINTFNYNYDIHTILLISLYGIFCNLMLKLFEKSPKLIIKIIFILIYMLFCIVYFFGYIIYAFDADLNPIETNKAYRHEYMCNELKNINIKHFINHFPEHLPSQVSNYYFYIERSFFGKDVNYVRFKTNKEYIQNVINENRNRICESYKEYNTDSRYYYIPYNEITDGEHGTIYILKTEDNKKYNKGIVISPAQDEILFFVSTFSLVPVWKEENPKCYTD